MMQSCRDRELTDTRNRIYGDNRFDMIHQRFLLGSISSYDDFYKKVCHALKPGGWVEIVEMEGMTFSDDGTLPEDCALNLWGRCLEEAFAKLGKPILKIEAYKELLEKQGFVNVQFAMVKRPTNDWPKDPKMKEIGRVSANTNSLYASDG